MDPGEANHMISTMSQAHPETMDLLSSAWCNFAVQAAAFHSDHQPDHSLVLCDASPIRKLDPTLISPLMNMDQSFKMDEPDDFVPPWKSNDLKSWIWMQQAMHPELNYNSYFKKKWMPWKIGQQLRKVPIKKWLTEMKKRSKEDKRLQRAEVHAALSVAGLAAALAAIAAENSSSKKHDDNDDDDDDDDDDDEKANRESAVASAAAIVAAQCAKVAEAMGAKKEQLRCVLGSAMSGTSASDILTLTAAATTSLRGAATLKVRAGYKNKLINGGAPVLPIEDNSTDSNFEFEHFRSVLAKGSQLNLEMPNGRRALRSVSIILNREAKVIVRIRKLNFIVDAFTRPQESMVLDLHAELYRESEVKESDVTCYLLVLKTNKETLKLDMMDDYQSFRTWSMTINHMLMLSSSVTKYQHQFCT